MPGLPIVSLFSTLLLLSCYLPIAYGNITPDIAHTQDEKALKASLLKIQSDIQALEKNLNHTKTEEDKQLGQLAQLEKALGEKEETSRALTQAIQSNHHKITALQTAYQKEVAHCQTEREALATLLKATYTGQRHEKLKILLSPNETAPLARRSQYYQYFYQARTKRLHDLQARLQEIANLQAQIHAEQERKLALAASLKQEKAAVEKTLEQRKNLLAKMTQQMAEDTASLASLKTQAEQLDTLCHTLQKRLAKADLDPHTTQSFAHMQQKLPWPLPQDTLQAVLTKKKKSGTGHNIYLAAAEGTPVTAIFPGKVVFSEWLRGIGLLIILDHGNGYMSLYGNNQKLYRSIGDIVEQGEMIARVGQSGGLSEGGLYFEIRKDGSPLDLSKWFQPI